MPNQGGRKEEEGRRLGPLPGGHHGLSPAQVAESQRERLLAAIAQLVAERGYQATTITEIARTASVSSRIFYANFESKEACYLAAFDAVLEHLEGRIAAAAAERVDWADQMVAALDSALAFLAEEPDLARAFLVEPATASPEIVARFREAVLGAVPHLRRGREKHPDSAALPDSTEDSVIGGLVALISRSVLDGADRSDDLLPDVVNFALAPYLGSEEARRLGAAAAKQRAV